MKKGIRCVVMVAILAISMIGCGPAENVEGEDIIIPTNGFGDIRAGIVIALGMTKTEIDEQFDGEEFPEVYEGTYIGFDENDEVKHIHIDILAKNSWETSTGIKRGSARDEVTKYYGDGELSETNINSYIYSYDGIDFVVEYDADTVDRMVMRIEP